MEFLKWPNFRAKHRVPIDNDEDNDESASGGYLVSADPGASTMTLAEPIESMRAESFSVSPHLLLPGRNYLLGGPRGANVRGGSGGRYR